MIPFKERSKYSVDTKLTLSEPVSGTIINKDYVSGVDIHLFSDLMKRKTFTYISCADWQLQDELNVFTHENIPNNLGQSLDLREYTPWTDQTERLSPDIILTNNVVESVSIDEIRDMKDGRIFVLIPGPLSYFMREEYPFSARGLKGKNLSLNGIASKTRIPSPYYDAEPDLIYQQSVIAIEEKYLSTPFQDTSLTVVLGSLSIAIDDDDFSRFEIRGSDGYTYSKVQSGVDSVAFGGLYR